jgi:hypothetical protein
MRALFGAALLALAFMPPAYSQEQSPGGGISAQQEQPQSSAPQKSPASNEQATSQPPFIVNVVPAPKTEEERAEEARERKEKAELDTRLVDFTAGLFYATLAVAIATIFLVIATAGLAVFGFIQSRDMRTSVVVAKKSADAALIALRPWISCKVEIGGPLTYTPDGHAEFMFRFIVENVGHSPAFGVRLTPRLNLLSPKYEHSIAKLQKMAQLNRTMPLATVSILIPGNIPISGAELGLILFPKEPRTFNYKIPIKRVEIESSCEDIKPNMHFFPEVYGLVTYTYPLADVRADTGFVCGIDNVSPDSTSGLAFELDESVRLEYLRVADHSLWSGFAT